jgi:hypothetical protein
MTELYSRHIKVGLDAALDDTPVVVVVGPRQAGKSTLASLVAEERGARYVTLDNDGPREAANTDCPSSSRVTVWSPRMSGLRTFAAALSTPDSHSLLQLRQTTFAVEIGSSGLRLISPGPTKLPLRPESGRRCRWNARRTQAADQVLLRHL